MDAKKTFKLFMNDLKKDFPAENFEFDESQIQDFEEFITPNIVKVLQRDSSLFEEPMEIFEVDISPLIRLKSEPYWKHIQSCSFAAFLSGNIKEKVGKLLGNFKHLWGGETPSELDAVLGTEESRSKVSEILEFVMTTKLAKIVTSLVETLDISSFGIDFENPEEVLKSIQDPQNKIMDTIMKKIRNELDSRLRRGEFTKEMLVKDIETIKVKVQEAFGDMFNDMLGGRKAEVSPQVILGNTPEARRARMMARLKRKVGEMKTTQ